MFYIDLGVTEENSTRTTATDQCCGPRRDNETPFVRPPVKKRSEKTFNLPAKKIPQPKCNNSNPLKPLINCTVSNNQEGTCYSLIKRIQNSQTSVGPMAQKKDVKDNDQKTSLKKRDCVVRELVATEKSYVKDLALIVDGYMQEMKDQETYIPLPDDLKGGKKNIIFGNVVAIYEWHRGTFLRLLEECVQCPFNLGPLIQRCKPKLRMYVFYCQNKPISEHIVTEHLDYFEGLRLKLKLEMSLSALLIKPVQRIMPYELLLKSYQKYTDRAGLLDDALNIQKAINVIQEVPKEANDMMVVSRLLNFEDEITAQGKLLLHGSLLYMQVGSNMDYNDRTMLKLKEEVQLFLFEKIVILSEIVGKKTQFTDPIYIYKTHIQVNKMKVEVLSCDRILLRSTERPELSFILMGQTQEDYREWADELTGILRKQTDFLEGLQNPISYQRQSTEL